MWSQYYCRRPLLLCMWSKELVNCDLRDKNDFIEYYFKRDFRYGSILLQLDIHHKMKMSLRPLKRRLKVLGLNKSHATASAAVIKQIIEREIEGPSMLRDYRSMWNKLRTPNKIIALIGSVMEILREVDPLRSNERRSIRFSYTWMYRCLLPKNYMAQSMQNKQRPKNPSKFLYTSCAAF